MTSVECALSSNVDESSTDSDDVDVCDVDYGDDKAVVMTMMAAAAISLYIPI